MSDKFLGHTGARCKLPLQELCEILARKRSKGGPVNTVTTIGNIIAANLPRDFRLNENVSAVATYIFCGWLTVFYRRYQNLWENVDHHTSVLCVLVAKLFDPYSMYTYTMPLHTCEISRIWIDATGLEIHWNLAQHVAFRCNTRSGEHRGIDLMRLECWDWKSHSDMLAETNMHTYRTHNSASTMFTSAQ